MTVTRGRRHSGGAGDRVGTTIGTSRVTGIFRIVALRAVVATAVVCLWPAVGRSQPVAVRGPVARGAVGADGAVTLPYTQTDSTGVQWVVMQNGMMRQQSGQPIFAQADNLTVNGAGSNGASNKGRVDPKTGELILDNLPFPNCTATRRILIGHDVNYVRVIDVFKNTQSQPINISVSVQSFINFGIQNSTVVNDPKKNTPIGYVMTTGIGRAAAEMYAGKGSKIVPNISSPQGNNMIQAELQLSIAPGKSAAVMRLLMTSATANESQQFMTSLKESDILRTLPPELRRSIVNFGATTATYVNDLEILRGDMFDVIELRPGDQMKGTIEEANYRLTTSYGTVDLPAEQVIGLINVGQIRPRQLIITGDGQIFGGQLSVDSLSMELSSGQVVKVPLAQITRAGYRKRTGEPDEFTFDKPFVQLRTGDRINVVMPTGPIEVQTRYGLLKLDPNSIASLLFQSDETGVHQVLLTDGSKFSGLVTAPQFDMKLATATGQTMKFPASSVVRFQLVGAVADTDDTTPSLSMGNEDLLIGTLSGQLKLDTAFDTLQLDGAQIRRIAHLAPGSADLEVTLWDGTRVSGQLETPQLDVKLMSGPTMSIPVALMAEYNQPMPQPAASMIDRIKATVADLSADDWKQRDSAEATLVAMGQPVLAVLREMRPSQSPEAQARIDAVIKQVSGAKP